MTGEEYQTLFSKLHDIEATMLEIKSALALRPAATDSSARAEERVAKMNCPKCGGAMTLRSAKTSGKQFAGCRGYPACDGIRWLSGDVPPDRPGNVSKPVAKPPPLVESGGDDVPF